MRISWLGGATTFGGVSASATTTAPTSASGRRLRLAAASSSPSHRHRTAAAMAEAHNEGRVRRVGDVRDAPAGRENDLEAIELARFAVAEHNSKTVRQSSYSHLFYAEIGDRRAVVGPSLTMCIYHR